MESGQTNQPVLLFDLAGRTYRFASEAEVFPHRVDARTCCGVAAAPAQAPAEVARNRPPPGEPEVIGHHFIPDSEFYHTTWEWGDLDFDGQDGLTGSFFCCHAHFSPEDARAYYDPSCDLLPVEDGRGGSREDGVLLG